MSWSNILAAVLATGGTALTWWAFQDPEKGKYEKDVEVINWSATHSVTCKCEYETLL
jgi:hypothetical protein